MPAVTIIMPAYNVAAYIGASLRSVLAQTYTSWECIVVDDGSTDNTAALVTEFSDPRIRLVRQENAGVSAARNRGIHESKGKYIAFLDADDLWTNNFLASLVPLLEHTDATLAYAQFERFLDVSFIIKKNPWESSYTMPSLYTTLLFFPLLHLGSVLARKESILAAGLFNNSYTIAEDRDFLFRLTLQGKAVGIEQALLFYRLRLGSGVAQHDTALAMEWKLMQEYITHPSVPLSIQKRARSSLAFKMAVIAAFGKKSYGLALRWYFKAILLAPLNRDLYYLPYKKLRLTVRKKTTRRLPEALIALHTI